MLSFFLMSQLEYFCFSIYSDENKNNFPALHLEKQDQYIMTAMKILQQCQPPERLFCKALSPHPNSCLVPPLFGGTLIYFGKKQVLKDRKHVWRHSHQRGFSTETGDFLQSLNELLFSCPHSLAHSRICHDKGNRLFRPGEVKFNTGTACKAGAL